MIQGFPEDHIEHAGIETLRSLGWSYFHGGVISPRSRAAALLLCGGDPRPEAGGERRADQSRHSRGSSRRRHRQVLTDATPNLVEENRRLHRYHRRRRSTTADGQIGAQGLARRPREPGRQRLARGQPVHGH